MEKKLTNNPGRDTDTTGDQAKKHQQTKIATPKGVIKYKNGTEVVINPNAPQGFNQNDPTAPGMARPMTGGKIFSSYDQFFGKYIAEKTAPRVSSFSQFVEELELGHAEDFFESTGEEEYEDWGEPEEEGVIYEVLHEKKGPCWTGYDMVGMKKKGGRKVPNCVPIKEDAEKGGRKVKLGKPFLTPDGPKKRSVYVKNEKGNVIKVNFGDPNMRIKKNSPAHRKSFRARHGCDVNPGPRTKAKYWSCKQW